MLLFVGALLLGLAAYVVAQTRAAPARQRREVVKRAATYGARPTPGVPAGARTSDDRSLALLMAWVATCVLRVLPRTTRSTVTQRLLRAGLANRLSVDGLLATKGLLALAAGVLGLFTSVVAGGAMGFLFALCLGAMGFVAPDMFVNSRITQRRERIQAALPDALDLLAVVVEAGLGFDAAIAKLTEYTDGPLAEELALTLNEMRIGETRTDALKRMGNRVGVAEVTSFVRAVVQADQLGMSIGATLRVQADDTRVRRQLAAEEKAMKAPIKMLFPMVFLILPATFIVVLGPFFISFDEYF